jgi:cytochrome c5
MIKVLQFLLLLVLVTGCGQEDSIKPEDSIDLSAIYETSVITPEVQQKWARSCALCHVAGEGGAPRTGNAGDWQARLDKGPAQLLHNTLVGFNRMPPLGYCMDCNTRDFAAMIKMMTAGIE